MYKNFTYLKANFPESEWDNYKDELLNLYNFYKHPINQDYVTFYTLGLTEHTNLESRNDFIKICPTLYSRLVNLELDSLVTFLSFIVVPPGFKNNYLHIDTTGVKLNNEDFSIALNFPVLNCNKSYTVWYYLENRIIDNEAVRVIRPESKLDQLRVNPRLAEIYKNKEEAVEVSRFEVVQPYWINTSIPHAIQCDHDDLRIAVTFRFPFSFVDTIKLPKFDKLFLNDENTPNWR